MDSETNNATDNNALIAEIKRLEYELQMAKSTKSNTIYFENLLALINNLSDIIYSVDMEFKLTAFNNAFEKMALFAEGVTLEIGKNIFDQLASLNNDDLYGHAKRALNGEKFVFQKKVIIQNEIAYFEVTLAPIYNNENVQVGILIHSRDVTNLNKSKSALAKSNRELYLLNLVNEEILQTKNERELLLNICKIIAENGEYDLIWVGNAVKSNKKQMNVSPIAWAGTAINYLNEIVIDLKDEELNKGPVGMAMNNNKSIVFNNIDLSGAFKPWKNAIEKYGFNSVASFPLNYDNNILASINFYSSKENSFDDNELEILNRISNHLCFAIMSIRNTLAKQKVERELLASNERFDYATKATVDAIWDLDLKQNKYYLGEGFEKLFGYNSHNIVMDYKKWEELVHPDDKDRVTKSLLHAIENSEITTWSETYQYKKFNNEFAHVIDKAILLKDKKGITTRIIGAMQDVTELTNESQKLKLYASIITNANDGVLISKITNKSTLNTKIIYVNDAFCKMTGYNNAELLNCNTEIFYGPLTNKEVINQIEIKKQKFEKFQFEIINYKKDGTLFWIDFSAVPITNEKGEYTHWISIQRDITARKKSEEEKEILYKTIKSINEFEYLKDAFTNTLEIICQYFEFDYGEAWSINIDKAKMLFRSFWSSNSEMDLMYQSIEYFEILKGNGIAGVTLQEEKIVVWPNVDKSTLNRKNVAKSLGIKSVVGIPIFYNNEVIAIFAFFSKTELQSSLFNNNLLNTISHQIGAYIQKNKSENELNMFFNISPDLICIAGYDGYFKKINGTVSKFLNYPNEKLLSEPLINFVHPDDREQTLNIRKNIHEGNTIVNFENRYVTATGEVKWLNWTTIPIDNEKLVFGVAKDVTERKKMEEERKELINELTRSNNELKQFSYITSHNMRSPLTNLLSIADLIDTSLISDETTVQLIEGFKISTIHLNETLNDLIKILIIKENTNLELEKLNIKEVLGNVTNSIKSLLNNTTFELNLEEIDSVMFNKSYLESIFLNLTTNAIKYAHPSRNPIIKISTKLVNNKIELTFEDNGIGFNEQKVKDKIFGLYQKFHNHADSKGIGLYLVKSQIIALGGSIKVNSIENVGTKFIITFVNNSNNS